MVLALATLCACGGMQLGTRTDDPGRTTPGTPRPSAPSVAAPVAGTLDAVAFLRDAGMIAHGYPLAFAGSVGFLAAAHADSALSVVSLSLAPMVLTFRREGDVQRADYRVALAVRRGESVVARYDASEAVRVGSIRETARADDAIVFQQVLAVPRGDYVLRVSVHDEGSGRSGTAEVPLRTPGMAGAALSSPIAVLDVARRASRDSLPRLVANPRSVAAYGRDTAFAVYLESYGAGSTVPLALSVRSEGETLWSGSATLTPSADGGLATAIARIPVERIAPGAATLVVERPGSDATSSAPLFVSVGDEIPPTTFSDLLGYLRYFALEARLASLASTPAAQRALAWAAFYRETDPDVSTRQHEGLVEYLTRMRHANASFPEAGVPGWQTDRGMVWLSLGPYDRVVDPVPGEVDRRGRSLMWEYRSLNLTVEFLRVGQLDRWRLTEASAADVRAAWRRLVAGGG